MMFFIPNLKSWCQNDSVKIAYSDLRIAVSKMTELEYVKKQNQSLSKICQLDSLEINNLNNKISELKVEIENSNKTIKHKKTERNIFIGTTIAAIVYIISIKL